MFTRLVSSRKSRFLDSLTPLPSLYALFNCLFNPRQAVRWLLTAFRYGVKGVSLAKKPSGNGRIRTHKPFLTTDFQDRRIYQLCHVAIWRIFPDIFCAAHNGAIYCSLPFVLSAMSMIFSWAAERPRPPPCKIVVLDRCIVFAISARFSFVGLFRVILYYSCRYGSRGTSCLVRSARYANPNISAPYISACFKCFLIKAIRSTG